MRRLKTLRVRLALWTAGLFLLGLTLFGVYVYGSMARGLSAAVDDSLLLNASHVVAGLDIENGQLIPSDSFIDIPATADFRGRDFTIRVLSSQGHVLQAFGSSYALSVPSSSTPSFVTLIDPTHNTTVRVYTAPVESNNRLIAIVQVAQSLGDLENTLQRLLITLLVGGPLLILIAGGSGYLLTARALAPIDRITRTARRISAEDLSARLNLPSTDDEVGRLAETFDAMLARLDGSFQRERQFTADAAHELRTPLTAMQAIFGMIRAKRRPPAEYEQALSDLAEEADRLQTLAENLLRLARGDQRAPQVVDLSTLLRDVADSLRPLAEAKALHLTCHVPDSLTLVGDGDDLIRLFVNLVDNAIKYTDHGGITLSASQNKDNSASVRVADTGSGISAEQLPYIFDRFYRVDKSRTMCGAGLGLAISLDIARAHGGVIEAHSEMGKGTTLTVRLPQASGAPATRAQ